MDISSTKTVLRLLNIQKKGIKHRSCQNKYKFFRAYQVTILKALIGVSFRGRFQIKGIEGGEIKKKREKSEENHTLCLSKTLT